ncbi:MAG: hypothetical protein M1133_13230 [Armatimonadetes bacterium]|nr:hypothetical protein [Armatimonadota bacterium]
MKTIAITGILLILLSLACMAADNPKVTMDAKDTPFDQVLAELGKQAGVQIVCDSAVKGPITGHFESVDLEKLLDTLTKSRGLTWQKLYLPGDSDQKPTLEQLRARTEAIAAISGGPIVICDPVTGKQKVYVEQTQAAQSVEPDKLGLKPVYLVAKPKSDKLEKDKNDEDLGKQFQTLQQDRLKLLAKMTPEQRVAAMQQEMTSMMTLTPEMRQQVFLDQFKARQSMDPQMRDQYRQMMRDSYSALREQGLIPEGRGFGGRGRNRGNRGDGGNDN